MTGLFCFVILLVCFALVKSSSRYPNSKGYALFRPQALFALLLFSLFVGLRYNPDVDKDFMAYWEAAEGSLIYYEYDRFELLPRLLADFVHYFHLPPSVWFILMGAILMAFTLFAACRIDNKYMPIVFVGLLLMYLQFDMNVMRQGIAISVFLCAATYMADRNWKMFLLFMAIAFGFHRSSIIWVLLYPMTFLDYSGKYKKIIFFVVCLSALAVITVPLILDRMSFVLSILGKQSKNDIISYVNELEIEQGSGIGVIIQCVRWLFLLYYIPKIFRMESDNRLLILLSIFVIGTVMNLFVRYNMLLARMSLFPMIIELLLYPYVIDYGRKNAKSGWVIKAMTIMQVVFLSYCLYRYLNEWNFVPIG